MSGAETEVRRWGTGYADFRVADGRRLTGERRSVEEARRAAGAMAARANWRERACLGCGRAFPSEGAHHRMCTPCRPATPGRGLGREGEGVPG